jgi:hypothetical protein
MSKNSKRLRRLDRQSHSAALSRRSAVAGEPCDYRALAVRASSLDAANRSIELQLSTETPVPMFDYDRWEMVPEILLTDGALLPDNRQVPLLDCHDRSCSQAQLGSIRNLAAGPGGIEGRAFFSSAAEDAWTKVREGHLTDVSVGYQVLERTYIPKDAKQTIRGREFSGPANVATKWRVREGSVTPIGADQAAKMRGLDLTKPPSSRSNSGKRFTMNEALRAYCLKHGLKADATDDEAQRFLAELLGRQAPAATAAAGGVVSPAATTPAGPSRDANGGALTVPSMTAEEFRRLFGEVSLEAARKAAAEEKTRADALRKDIDALCLIGDVPDKERAAFYTLPDIEKVREEIFGWKKRREEEFHVAGGIGPQRIEWTGNGRDEQRSDMATALTLRALNNAKPETLEKVFPAAERGKHPERFRNAGMFDIARECVAMDGINVRGLSREQIALCALGFFSQAGVRGAFDPAYSDTGSFPKLTQDAINKSMMVGYTECPMTWRLCFRQGPSAQDFKSLHRIRIGAVPNLPDWASNVDPEAVTLADAEETYKVQAKSAYISFSYQLLVNDDMSILSRVPGMFGAAAARTVNALAWAQITSNPTLGDGVALFSAASGARKRANTTTGVNVPSVANLQTLKNLMRQMRGENTPEGNESNDILHLTPRFIVGPGALETKIKQLVMSAYDPAASQFQTYNTATELTPIIEPLLDVASTTAWYVFADTNQIDTVEVTFLQGHETPVTRNWADPAKLTQNYAVLQAVAAKALNHRGLQQMVGA